MSDDETGGQWFKARVPLTLRRAFIRCCQRQGTRATTVVVDAMRRYVRRHGDDQDLADLHAAEAELARPRPGPKRR